MGLLLNALKPRVSVETTLPLPELPMARTVRDFGVRARLEPAVNRLDANDWPAALRTRAGLSFFRRLFPKTRDRTFFDVLAAKKYQTAKTGLERLENHAKGPEEKAFIEKLTSA